MRISDWSSDVCSSDLAADRAADAHADPDPQVRADGQTREDILVNGERQRGAKGVASPVNAPRPVVVLPGEVIQQTGSATLQDRSEEHTSKLQSLMRISYADSLLTKNITYICIRELE